MYKKNDILYDCYDKDGNYIGIIFARDYKELLEICPKVKYVRGADYITREENWFIVDESGLHCIKGIPENR